MEKEIYFAGGCFWGTQHFMKQIKGVIKTEVGYANPNKSWTNRMPSYEEVCTGTTGFAETVKVIYRNDLIQLESLVSLFFKTIDPTSLNRQGNDSGTQYRTGIYFTQDNDEQIIRRVVDSLSQNYVKPVVIEIKSLQSFYRAEEYHQDYLSRNPNGYCHISPDLFKSVNKDYSEENRTQEIYVKRTKEELKRELTDLQFSVTQENATERPYNNEYWLERRDGIYVDVTTGEPLFVSTDKFSSECGWPAFSKPISEDVLVEKTDNTHGMQRIEVRSKTGDSHLGHVFTDGPSELGGLRYCINSASLRFIPKEEMQKSGYESYLYLFK